MDGNIYQKISSRNKQRRNQLNELEATKAKAEKVKAARDKEAAEILKKGSTADYVAAKEASRKAADEIDFYTKQIEELQKTPVFDQKEITKYKTELDAKLQKDLAADMAQALTHLELVLQFTQNALEATECNSEYYRTLTGKEPRGVLENIQAINSISGLVERCLALPIMKKYNAK